MQHIWCYRWRLWGQPPQPLHFCKAPALLILSPPCHEMPFEIITMKWQTTVVNGKHLDEELTKQALSRRVA